MVQAGPRAGGVHEAGHRTVLGAGRLCVQHPGSARASAALGAPGGPQPLPALKRAQGRGVWASGARQLSRRSLPQHPACPPRRPRLPDCPLWGRISGRQVVRGPRPGPPPPELAPLGQRVCGSDLGVRRPPLRSGPPHVDACVLRVTWAVLAESVLVLCPGSFGSSTHVFVHFKSVAQRPSWVHPPHGASLLGRGLGCHVCPRNVALEGRVWGDDC